jgi:hypothetical protein
MNDRQTVALVTAILLSSSVSFDAGIGPFDSEISLAVDTAYRILEDVIDKADAFSDAYNAKLRQKELVTEAESLKWQAIYQAQADLKKAE